MRQAAKGAVVFRRIPTVRIRSFKRWGHAFTLIELLVVLATIAVLAGLLIPSLARAKFLGRNATCKNNLRQMGLAVQMYASHFDAFPTFIRSENFGSKVYWGQTHWDQLLEKVPLSESACGARQCSELQHGSTVALYPNAGESILSLSIPRARLAIR